MDTLSLFCFPNALATLIAESERLNAKSIVTQTSNLFEWTDMYIVIRHYKDTKISHLCKFLGKNFYIKEHFFRRLFVIANATVESNSPVVLNCHNIKLLLKF